MQPVIDAFNRTMTATFPVRPLAVFRILMGMWALLTVPEVAGAWERAGTLAGWPHIDGATWSIFGGVYALLALALVVGFTSRCSAALLGLLTLYTMYAADRYQNHLAYLVSILLLMALADTGAAWSLDRVRSGRPSPERVLKWPVTLLKLQVCVLYLFAGINKLNGVFWTGDTIRVVGDDSLFIKLPGGADPWPWIFIALGVSGLLWELSMPFALWIPGRVQAIAMIAGVSFHLGMCTMMASSWARAEGVIVFALVSWSGYLLFEPVGPLVADRLAELVRGERRVRNLFARDGLRPRRA